MLILSVMSLFKYLKNDAIVVFCEQQRFAGSSGSGSLAVAAAVRWQ
jgi:hypothetical protein